MPTTRSQTCNSCEKPIFMWLDSECDDGSHRCIGIMENTGNQCIKKVNGPDMFCQFHRNKKLFIACFNT